MMRMLHTRWRTCRQEEGICKQPPPSGPQGGQAAKAIKKATGWIRWIDGSLIELTEEFCGFKFEKFQKLFWIDHFLTFIDNVLDFDNPTNILGASCREKNDHAFRVRQMEWSNNPIHKAQTATAIVTKLLHDLNFGEKRAFDAIRRECKKLGGGGKYRKLSSQIFYILNECVDCGHSIPYISVSANTNNNPN